MTTRIDVNWALCDGNGMCAIEAPRHFALTDDDELLLLQETVDESDLVEVTKAVRSCPKHALMLQTE